MSEKSDKKPKMQYSASPTLFSDGANIACRSDGGVLLEFVSSTPDRIVENFRTVMGKEEIINFIDSLSSALDYYPIKKNEDNNVKKSEKS